MFATKVEGFRRSCHNPADTAEKTVNRRPLRNNFAPVTPACHNYLSQLPVTSDCHK